MSTDLLPANYLPIVVFIAIAFGFGAVTILVGYLVRPSKPYKEKLYAYESGIHPLTDARQMFPLRYYMIAMLFVIFDIEVVFLYPWAVAFQQLGLFALVEMVLFLSILFVGYFYAWKKGALNGIDGSAVRVEYCDRLARFVGELGSQIGLMADDVRACVLCD
ncbi:MAG: NADH-quinone oxidoreductase subunit A [Candidatus Manganitrophus sp.]|nr:MAG: NADH-quinone oxidoreductase subunit A [Candidatus Manganitrophus sp.]